MQLLFREEAHEYFLEEDNGDWWKIPSVSHVLSSMGFSPDYSFVDPFTMENSRRIGTAVHKHIEDYFNDSLKVSDISDECEDLMDSFFAMIEKMEVDGKKLVPLALEKQVWRDYGGIQVAGTIDFHGHIVDMNDEMLSTEEVIIDWKTSARIYPSHKAQLVAYADMMDALVNPYCVHLNKKGTPGRIKEAGPPWGYWPSVMNSFLSKVELKIEKEYEARWIP